jgi:hypothetical protein
LIVGNAGVVNIRDNQDDEVPDKLDVVILVGAARLGDFVVVGAILSILYCKQVAIFESHYLPGGCTYVFDRKAANGETFKFDYVTTILLLG